MWRESKANFFFFILFSLDSILKTTDLFCFTFFSLSDCIRSSSVNHLTLDKQMSAHDIYILLVKKLYFIPPVESLFGKTHTQVVGQSLREWPFKRGEGQSRHLSDRGRVAR
jgi:hypothetical protein